LRRQQDAVERQDTVGTTGIESLKIARRVSLIEQNSANKKSGEHEKRSTPLQESEPTLISLVSAIESGRI
jgi:hypothetical protein